LLKYIITIVNAKERNGFDTRFVVSRPITTRKRSPGNLNGRLQTFYYMNTR